MKATAFEFRFRLWIMVTIYVLGFVAPWDRVLHLDGIGPRAHLWGVLAAQLSRTGALGIGPAFNLLLVAGILCAGAGAWLRTWGSAYLGLPVVRSAKMQGDGIVADGPYRHMRNPLYLGSWLNTLALALLMTASGAVFTLVLVVLFQVRLILAEESFLTGKLGDAYLAYRAQVPRLLPSPWPRVAASGTRPEWLQAALAEIFMWGVTAAFAVLGWRYDAFLLVQCVLVSLGVSLVVRALQMQDQRVQNRPGA